MNKTTDPLTVDRRKALENINRATEIQRWCNDPLTVTYLASLQNQRDAESDSMQKQIDDGDKPIPAADQSRHQGRRSLLVEKIGFLQSGQHARLNAVRDAMGQESVFKNQPTAFHLAPWENSADGWDLAASILADGGDPFDPKHYPDNAPVKLSAAAAAAKIVELGGTISVGHASQAG